MMNLHNSCDSIEKLIQADQITVIQFPQPVQVLRRNTKMDARRNRGRGAARGAYLESTGSPVVVERNASCVHGAAGVKRINTRVRGDSVPDAFVQVLSQTPPRRNGSMKRGSQCKELMQYSACGRGKLGRAVVDGELGEGVPGLSVTVFQILSKIPRLFFPSSRGTSALPRRWAWVVPA